MYDYKFFPDCLLRTPAFSFERYSAANLPEMLKDTYFQAALLTASSSLHTQLSKAGFEYDRLAKKEKLALLKYYNRICFRPTPFGLFAGFSLVGWGSGPTISISRQKIHMSGSFGQEYTSAGAIRQTVDREMLTYRVNASVYDYGDELRYLFAELKDDQSGFEFSIQAVSNIPVLKKIARFAGQYQPYESLLDFLVADEGLEEKIAHDLLSELINLQFLLDEFCPNITGIAYQDRISSRYPGLGKHGKMEAGLISIPAGKLGPSDYLCLSGAAGNARDVYVNTEAVASGTLNTGYQDALLGAIGCLDILNITATRDSGLAKFIARYEQKFDQQALPLLYALDPETGIGYQELSGDTGDNALLRNIHWGDDRDEQAPGGWTQVHRFLLKKWHGNGVSLERGAAIRITPEDLKDLAPSPAGKHPAPTASILFRVLDGDKLLIEGLSGVTATALIGRFTPFNEQLAKFARSVAETERRHNPGVLFAEISHVCEMHAANINRRKHSYAYEIPVLTASTLPEDCQLPLSDIWIFIANGEVILYSKKKNARIIPRLSSAFNYNRNNLTVFKFLGEVQFQGLRPGSKLDLSSFFPGLDYYPRVAFLNTILCPASWHLRVEDLAYLYRETGEQQLQLFRKLSTRLSFPGHIDLTFGDHQLVFNLAHGEEVVFFLETIKSRQQVIPEEYLLPGGGRKTHS